MDSGRIFLEVQGLQKSYGDFDALREVSFSAVEGEFVSVLGPSGCGKTTLLRVIAGLDFPNRGRVAMGGEDVSAWPVARRNVGVVFQSYALFPNLTARENIGYGLKGRIRDRREIREKVSGLLKLVGLSGMGRKYPAQLSGGQQQRVALVRALALSPRLLLLDEPLSALDAQVRILLRSEIRQLQRRLGLTTLMVPHDQEEALTMADRILVMNQGRIVQDGPPREIYDAPVTPFVAAFIGAMNFIPDAVKQGRGVYAVGDRLLTVAGENGASGLPAGASVRIAIRPEDIRIHPTVSIPDANTFSAFVERIEYRGAHYRMMLKVALKTDGSPKETVLTSDISAETVRRHDLKESMILPVHLPPERLRVYP